MRTTVLLFLEVWNNWSEQTLENNLRPFLQNKINYSVFLGIFFDFLLKMFEWGCKTNRYDRSAPSPPQSKCPIEAKYPMTMIIVITTFPHYTVSSLSSHHKLSYNREKETEPCNMMMMGQRVGVSMIDLGCHFLLRIILVTHMISFLMWTSTANIEHYQHESRDQHEQYHIIMGTTFRHFPNQRNTR